VSLTKAPIFKGGIKLIWLFCVPVDGAELVNSSPADHQYWLPGGGVEAGETPVAALARELLEEAAATLHTNQPIGVQHVTDTAGANEYHSFYWCRITLDDTFTPQHEIVVRKLVALAEFLDTLFWGRTDPKGRILLDLALQLERQDQ
jgi:ADP-ribose pyrophosphatase YjhB (NUDIX family)